MDIVGQEEIGRSRAVSAPPRQSLLLTPCELVPRTNLQPTFSQIQQAEKQKAPLLFQQKGFQQFGVPMGI